MNSEQGVLGETIFNVAISRGYLFRPRSLGEKWPVSDFYVELISFGEHYHFFVQVKSTVRGRNTEGRLKVSVPQEAVNRLSQYCAPTYVAGVDIKTEEVFLVGVNHLPSRSIEGTSTVFELTDSNLKILFDEVKGFWDSSGIKTHKAKFIYQL